MSNNETLILTDDLFLGKGAHKETYKHPNDKTLCVKIVYKVPDFDLSKEMRYRRALGSRADEMTLITKYFGTVETNKGTGYLFELVNNYDGSNSDNLKDYLHNCRDSAEAISLLLKFKLDFFRDKCVVADTDTQNFFVQYTSPTEVRVRIVDNIGTGAKIPILYHSDYLLKKRAIKYWRQFVHQIRGEQPHIITDEIAQKLLDDLPPMKICLLVKDFAVGKKFSKNGLPTKSGAEFHAENHALELIKRGNEVTIMAKKRYFFTKARENINGIDLVRLHAPFRWLEIILRLLTTHRNIDTFYIIGTPKFAVWAVLFANLFHKPVILALTGKAEIFDKNTGWRNKIFSKCGGYIATTHEIQRGFIERGGIKPKCIEVLAHGINTSKYPKSDENRRHELKLKHGLNSDTPVLLFCARVVIDKGIDTVMKFWPTIHKKNPTAKLFVVGGGRNEILADLRDLSKKVDDSIIVTGEMDKPQEFYQMADVYIFPSRHEGLPTSLIEAMSSGLPAVVSDIGGCDDLIFDDETGYRVPPEDAESFVEKILKLFNDSALRQKLGDNGADYVRKHCDYNTVIPRLQFILHDAFY